MRLPAFLAGMVLVAVLIAVSGVYLGTSAGKIVMLVICSTVVAQGLYLALILFMAQEEKASRKSAVEPAGANDTEKTTARDIVLNGQSDPQG